MKGLDRGSWVETVDHEWTLASGNCEVVLKPQNAEDGSIKYTIDLLIAGEAVQLDVEPRTFMRARAAVRAELRQLAKNVLKIVERG